MLLFDGCQFAEETIALCVEPLATLLFRLMCRETAAAGPCTCDEDGTRESECPVSRPHRLMRQAAQRKPDHLPGGNGRPFADNERRTLQRHIAMLGELWRLELHVADLLHEDAHLSQRQRHDLLDGQRPTGKGQRIAVLHDRRTGCERTIDDDSFSNDARLWCGTLEEAGTESRGRQIEDDRIGRFHRHPGRRDDVTKSERGERGFAVLAGPCAALTISKRANELSASSPISKTKRERSLSTTVPACAALSARSRVGAAC